MSRIIKFAPDIKKFYFIDEAHRSKEYRAFMNEVTLFVQTGKNKHDDVCASLAMLVEFLDTRGRVVTVMKRLLWVAAGAVCTAPVFVVSTALTNRTICGMKYIRKTLANRKENIHE